LRDDIRSLVNEQIGLYRRKLDLIKHFHLSETEIMMYIASGDSGKAASFLRQDDEIINDVDVIDCRIKKNDIRTITVIHAFVIKLLKRHIKIID
jgi:hypothetical protein